MLKSVLDYILVEERLDIFFLHFAWIGPLVGIIGGVIFGVIRGQFSRHIAWGFLWGLSTSFISALWLLYNGVVDHFGLDSAFGLVFNLVLFACIGLALGSIIRFFQNKKAQQAQSLMDVKP